jgi:hypothetical protein
VYGGQSEGKRIGNTVIQNLKLYDWTFSGTAEAVIGALLMIALVISTLA